MQFCCDEFKAAASQFDGTFEYSDRVYNAETLESAPSCWIMFMYARNDSGRVSMAQKTSGWKILKHCPFCGAPVNT